MHAIVLNRFIFFARRLQSYFFKQYICGYCDAVGYSSDRFYPCFVIIIVYTHSLYLIAEDKMSYGHLRCYFDQGAQNALDNKACLIL